MFIGKYKTWMSKEGKVYNIQEMSTEHIRNCISMLTRSFNPEENKENKDMFKYKMTIKHGEKYIKVFLKELKRRGLMYKRR